MRREERGHSFPREGKAGENTMSTVFTVRTWIVVSWIAGWRSSCTPCIYNASPFGNDGRDASFSPSSRFVVTVTVIHVPGIPS